MIINYPKPGTFTVGLKLAAVQQPPIQFGNRMFTYESRHDENHNKTCTFVRKLPPRAPWVAGAFVHSVQSAKTPGSMMRAVCEPPDCQEASTRTRARHCNITAASKIPCLIHASPYLGVLVVVACTGRWQLGGGFWLAFTKGTRSTYQHGGVPACQSQQCFIHYLIYYHLTKYFTWPVQ